MMDGMRFSIALQIGRTEKRRVREKKESGNIANKKVTSNTVH